MLTAKDEELDDEDITALITSQKSKQVTDGNDEIREKIVDVIR